MKSLYTTTTLEAPEKWAGIDETVVGKFAADAGRPPTSGMFDGMGDLPLLMFLLAGLVGGFALGYFYHGYLSQAPNPTKGDSDVV
ncbi:MAG: cobalt transporter [Nitrospinota bacterium]|nr:cobalt transporter [Nitrospinota bacterium]